MKFLIDEMDDSKKLYNQAERQRIPNCKELSRSNCKEERNDDKKSNKITAEGCSEFKSTVFDR